jgi:hypothetical protein
MKKDRCKKTADIAKFFRVMDKLGTEIALSLSLSLS